MDTKPVNLSWARSAGISAFQAQEIQELLKVVHLQDSNSHSGSTAEANLAHSLASTLQDGEPSATKA